MKSLVQWPDQTERGGVAPQASIATGLSVLAGGACGRYTESQEMETRGPAQKPSASHEFARTLVKLTVAGGIAFWVGTIVLSLLPIAAEYRALRSLRVSWSRTKGRPGRLGYPCRRGRWSRRAGCLNAA